MVVICFQQTIFDNNAREEDAGAAVVICFQQTIFDNFTIQLKRTAML